MSNKSSGLRKKPVTSDKSQVRKDATTRGVKDKLEVEARKNGERTVKRSSRPLASKTQEVTATSSGSKKVVL